MNGPSSPESPKRSVSVHRFSHLLTRTLSPGSNFDVFSFSVFLFLPCFLWVPGKSENGGLHLPARPLFEKRARKKIQNFDGAGMDDERGPTKMLKQTCSIKKNLFVFLSRPRSVPYVI